VCGWAAPFGSDKLTASHFVFLEIAYMTLIKFRNAYCATPGCINGIGRKRAAYGHLVCKGCGEEQARVTRQSWTVLQEYGKGGYQFVTPTAAFMTLRQTNQKAIRT
jgi:hypothetical protein